MTEREITSAGSLLDGQGQLLSPGWARQPLWQYNRNMIKAPAWRIKEWDYYLIMDEGGQYGIALTLSDLGYLAFFAVTYLDFSSGAFAQEELMQPLSLHKTGLVADPDGADIRVSGKNLSISVGRDNQDQRVISFEAAKIRLPNGQTGLSGRVQLDDRGQESINIATSWAENRKAFYYNRKLNSMPTGGVVTVGGEERLCDPAQVMTTLDWGRGRWTFENRWYWASLSCLVDGAPFGFNLGYGFSDRSVASENALFHNGKLHKLGAVVFEFDEADYMKPWRLLDQEGRLDVTMTPTVDRCGATNLLLLKSEQHQVFGAMTGKAVLDDGTEISLTGQTGFAEDVLNRW